MSEPLKNGDARGEPQPNSWRAEKMLREAAQDQLASREQQPESALAWLARTGGKLGEPK